ncbi:Ribosomal protein L28 [Elusimicrobium minutum Pei191]|uniref:Large ribosomal subunit protein bL28 n=1 Tax=Elusimicrobium minutum (strain Pei191) TaxID=445932 RepID=RL28_ELUMP|nr:50S ribosomal protein L28 [Elusimicrobium minutum]B2KAU3.1 RecName: Full=Large ribosomal subunit protein bL28; AltName: Full=50S ribosomal protein L28 [Elusimicrobium minutum Pei191]ACC97639.1 Ribosomal protein L28 [Elusimicrobium minutum Pei191]
MSYKCQLCGKGSVTGGSYSHSHRNTKRTFRPNLQKQKVVLEGKTQTAYVCTKCIKSGFTTKPVK